MEQHCSDFHSHVIGSSNEGTLCDVYLNVVTPVKASNPYQYYGKVKLLGATPRASNTSKTLKFGYNENMTFSNDYGYYYVTAIDKSFHYRGDDLKVLDLSQTSKMEEIEGSALYGCTALTTAKITAQKIGSYAFYNCTNLTSLTLSERVQNLGALSFAYTGMSNVTIPASLTTYGNGAFAYCNNLTRFYVASGSTNYATDSNTPNCLYSYSKSVLFQMGAGTNPINGDLNTYMPNALTIINPYAMAGSKLATVDIPYGVTTIHPWAFSGMPYVQTIRIPSSVTTMYANTFSGLSSTTFKNLYINLKTIPLSLQNSSAFSTLPTGVTLHVPRWRTNYYKSGSWWSGGWNSKFSSVVEDSYDFNYAKYASGNYIDYILYYTVSSTSSYTDTMVQSAAANGQLTVVGTYIGAEGYFNGTINFPSTTTHRGKTYITTEVQREVFRNQTRITSVTGGSGIKKIGALAFAGMTGMTGAFNIPNVVEFGDSCLFNSLATSLTLGDRVERIGIRAFFGCSRIVGTMIVPATTTYIGSYAWWGANSVGNIVLKGTTAPYVGNNVFNTSTSNTYMNVNLPIFLEVTNQTSPWLSSTGTSRRLLPCYVPTKQWSVISVPLNGDVKLPQEGEYYIANRFSKATNKLILEQLSNSTNGIQGYVGMLMKGTPGTVYYFRLPTTSNYTVINPSVNYLKGVTGYSQSLSSSQYVYYLDTSIYQFRKWTSNVNMTVYSGEGYLQLSNALVGNSTANVTFGTTITTYNLWIAGQQVDELNCSDLSTFDNVSGSIYFTPSNNTLYMNNVTILVPGGSYSSAIRNSMSSLVITCQGTNQLTTNSAGAYDAFSLQGNTIIAGTGTIKFNSTNYDGISFGSSCTLTIQAGVKVETTGYRYGVNGHNFGKIVLKGANTKLTAKGISASYYETPTTLNDGLAITAPAGAKFNNANTVVSASGVVVYNQNVVFSKPAFTRGDVNGDNSVTISDVTALIDYLLSGNASGINVSAADCNEDGSVSIGDVTALIDFLLKGTW